MENKTDDGERKEVVGMDELETVLSKAINNDPLNDYDIEVANVAIDLLVGAIARARGQVTIKQMLLAIKDAVREETNGD